MRKQSWTRIGSILIALTALAGYSVEAADVPPDLTRSETDGVDRAKTYNLGSALMSTGNLDYLPVRTRSDRFK